MSLEEKVVRVIYVFEVQTKDSFDNLIVNLLKSLNNPAVQAVVVVFDKTTGENQGTRQRRHGPARQTYTLGVSVGFGLK